MQYTEVIKDCINYGNVKGNSYVGGIVGQVSSDGHGFESCINYGNVKGNLYVGGIVGFFYGWWNESTSNCYNYGTSSGNDISGIHAQQTTGGSA